MKDKGETDYKNSVKPETKQKVYKPNIFSRFFVWWICPVLITGNRRDVEEEDLISPGNKYNSDKTGDYLERYWLEEYKNAIHKNRQPKLWKALVRAYWASYLPGSLYIIIQTIIRIFQPLLFAQLLSYWSVDSTMDRLDATYYALAMLGCNFVTMMCQHHNSLFVQRFGLKVKVACTSLLYRKILRTSQVSISDISGGKLVNLMSNDVARFGFAFMFLHQLWIMPIQVAVVLYFLYDTAGYAPYVGLFSVVIIILPIQVLLTKYTAVMRRETAGRTDKRIKLMSEIINGIQVIKMYAWEIPFQLVVKAARTYELKALKTSIFIRSVFVGFMMFTKRLILFVTCLTIVLSGGVVTATTIYPMQQYLNLIQMSLTMVLPFAFSNLAEMSVSLERIQNVLMLPEREDLAVTKTPKTGSDLSIVNNDMSLDEDNQITPKKVVTKDDSITVSVPDATVRAEYPIVLENVSASWSAEVGINDDTLKNISISLQKGTLCAVIGPVGSGKTSLLQLILREMRISKGNINVNGRISYACQGSWLFPGTVRENILFGLPYDSAKYKEVCQVCCLLTDFQQFPYKDLSLVGERGVSLSGGQKARINLARAVYRDADIYLLDDPLSAVDANVGRLLFEKCINGYLKGRTCILVTHQIHYLKAADEIIIMNEGSVENMGTFDELIKTGKEFSLLLQRQESKSVETDEKSRDSVQRIISVISNKIEDNSENKQIQKAEERAKGNLKWDVITQYLKAVQSVPILCLTLFTLAICQASATVSDYWLSYWTNQVDQYEQELGEGVSFDPSLDVQVGPLTTGQYLIVYGSVVLGVIIFSQLRILTYVTMAIRASANLHDTIYKKLIVAVMRFFDTNPSGRVLNRFSKDMGAIDEFLPRGMLETVQMYLTMISILILNGIALPWTLIPTAVLMVLFIYLLKWYLNAAQAVKRLEGTTKSPVFGMINSTIAGLSTVRSSKSEQKLLTDFDNAQNLHTSAFFTFIGGSTGFGLYLDGLCLIYLGAVIALFLIVDFSSVIPVGSVGLAISQSMALTSMLQMAAKITADFLGQMTAVERVLEYTDLPVENNIYEGPSKAPNEWPSEGNVKFEAVNLKYGPEDPLVLKNIHFDIKGGWKVGVVGRTGAGKSSLISALFRLYNIEGVVIIDGVNTKDISKLELRSKISIIPQEPVLFSATLRYNLDPFELYSDDDIWRALEQVELKEAVPALDFKVLEGGSNFSMGQRQLICLARALLRSNKILVMDEATANVDPQTDALIQKTIRREFATCTVITIAHRLNTIMDSDRVLVMDKGAVVEYDRPHILLSDPNTIFSFMVRETGESMSRTLIEIAKTHYENSKTKLT